MRKPAVVVLVLSLAALALALVPAAGLVAKGGNAQPGGKPGGGGGTASATLVPSCNPCAAGGVVVFSGSGYDASQGVAQVDISGALTSTAVYADGTIWFEWPYFGSPGSYDARTFQRRGGRLVLKAQATIVVE